VFGSPDHHLLFEEDIHNDEDDQDDQHRECSSPLHCTSLGSANPRVYSVLQCSIHTAVNDGSQKRLPRIRSVLRHNHAAKSTGFASGKRRESGRFCDTILIAAGATQSHCKKTTGFAASAAEAPRKHRGSTAKAPRNRREGAFSDHWASGSVSLKYVS
jgi:hypothetical protein